MGGVGGMGEELSSFLGKKGALALHAAAIRLNRTACFWGFFAGKMCQHCDEQGGGRRGAWR